MRKVQFWLINYADKRQSKNVTGEESLKEICG